jgi:1,4-dihydroxy-2-naphthoyl-CoA hydrolase
MGEQDAMLAGLAAFVDRQPMFSKLLRAKMTHASKDRLEAELTVGDDITNPRGILHGGALMALADNLGGAATVVNLPAGGQTTTIESKTNFFAAVSHGDTVRAQCTPLHRGRTTMVWETRIFRGDGKLAAIITQTQLVLMGGG